MKLATKVTISGMLAATLALSSCGPQEEDPTLGPRSTETAEPEEPSPVEPSETDSEEPAPSDPEPSELPPVGEVPGELPGETPSDPSGTAPAMGEIREPAEEFYEPFERSFDELVLAEPEGTQAWVSYWSGVEPCTVLVGVEVVESATAVELTLIEASGNHPDEEISCIALAVQVAAEVELAQPLGNRVVVDGTTGEEVPTRVMPDETAIAE